MKIENEEKFIKGVESLIQPMAVSNLLFFQRFKILLPPRIMKKLLYRASKHTPYIGFVIEPYSLFLFFKLKDIELARSMLPERYELAKTKLFVDDEPEYYMGIGNLSTRASTFWGTRQESYLIARDKQTGLLSFIFIDILSDTLISLPSKGIMDPNCSRALFTTSSKGEVFLEMLERKTNREFALSGSIKNGKSRKLDERLWVMGNTSIAYSKRFIKGDEKPFAVIFDPAEVDEAMDIPVEQITISKNSLFPGLAEEEINKVICFPFAQHYIADSPGCYTSVTDKDDLVRKYNEIGKIESFKTFSARTIINQLFIVLFIIALIAILLTVILK